MIFVVKVCSSVLVMIKIPFLEVLHQPMVCVWGGGGGGEWVGFQKVVDSTPKCMGMGGGGSSGTQAAGFSILLIIHLVWTIA